MLNLVNLLLTRKCNYECSHCIGTYGPDSEGKLTLEQAKYYIDQLPEQQTIDLNLTGGEPTLYNELIDVIQYADKVREKTSYPKKILMITNSWWAENKWKTDLEILVRNLILIRIYSQIQN
ncbi:MAG: 4Fe-4S cluster-binding domain-containing protein [Nanoarchaeota archaeon]|nr:4Fe-4S cluster-binding domain-containing protein [Nanoarchaeota archaeon]